MKQIFAIMLALVMIFTLCACGSKRKEPATVPTTQVTTLPTTAATEPVTMPTMETNVPDPSVDNNSTPDTTDLMPTDMTTATDTSEGTGSSGNTGNNGNTGSNG